MRTTVDYGITYSSCTYHNMHSSEIAVIATVILKNVVRAGAYEVSERILNVRIIMLIRGQESMVLNLNPSAIALQMLFIYICCFISG